MLRVQIDSHREVWQFLLLLRHHVNSDSASQAVAGGARGQRVSLSRARTRALGGALEMVREMATVLTSSRRGDGHARPSPSLALHVRVRIDFPRGRTRPADSSEEARPLREVVPMPAESGGDPISKTRRCSAPPPSLGRGTPRVRRRPGVPPRHARRFHRALARRPDDAARPRPPRARPVPPRRRCPLRRTLRQPRRPRGVPRVLLPRGSGGAGGKLGQGVGFVGYHNVVHACDVTQTTDLAVLPLQGLTWPRTPRSTALIIAGRTTSVTRASITNSSTEPNPSPVTSGSRRAPRAVHAARVVAHRRPEMRFHGRFPRDGGSVRGERALVLATTCDATSK